MNSKGRFLGKILRLAFMLIALFVLWKAGQEYLNFAWGSGEWLGAFTPKRGFGFIALVLIWGVTISAILMGFWRWKRAARLEQVIITWRERIGWLRFLLVMVVLLTPVWLFQYTYLGSLFTGLYLRLTLLLIAGGIVGALITHSNETLITASNLAAGLLILATALNLGQSFKWVTAYPFSLSWSEGNRMWDYSVLFGHRLYDYPADKSIYAYIDRGRQAIWGLPFLFFNLSIKQMRIWNSLVWTVPYALFGWIVFRNFGKIKIWILSGLWTYVFLSQGPIYTPLVVSAILVAIAWRYPRWFTLPLIAVAAYFAYMSRFTWTFAPAMWAGMLFLGNSPSDRKMTHNWKLAFVGVFAGLLGGYILPRWQNFSQMIDLFTKQGASIESPPAQADIISLGGIQSAISRQPLLWERLLPNPTYNPGILIALLVTTLPLITLLIYLIWKRRWPLNWLQCGVILVTMSLFLVVGIIISVKIGGGNNLHNLDMFLIGLVFTAALAWSAGGYRVLLHLDQEPVWIQALLVLMMIIYALPPLMGARPLNLPPDNVIQEALTSLQRQVARRKDMGEVLFIDQRQLLTFSYIEDVPLVPEYEKKYLMDQAMAGNELFFNEFHKDITNQRFALIISEILFINYKDKKDSFAEENNAWVKWVSEPVLCYYVPKLRLKPFKFQVLIPRNPSKICIQQ